MVKGAELDKQIYKEGEQTWGLKDGFLDVMDVKIFIGKIKRRTNKRRFHKIIDEEAGKGLFIENNKEVNKNA